MLQVFVSFKRYVRGLRWLTLSLLAYVGVVFAIDVPWNQVARGLLVPDPSMDREQMMLVVVLLGTTISPYLFLAEATETRLRLGVKSLTGNPVAAAREARRIRVDTLVGMAVSNLVRHAARQRRSADRNVNPGSRGLAPDPRSLAFTLFALGIVGTGMLSVPVLAASAAFAVGEALRWPTVLERLPREAKAFYGTIAAAAAVGAGALAVTADIYSDPPADRQRGSQRRRGGALAGLIMHMGSSARVMAGLTLPGP